MLYALSCVHTVAVFNAAFCMTCSLLMLVMDARGHHMEEAYCYLVCVVVECCVLYPCCMGVFGMFAVM